MPDASHPGISTDADGVDCRELLAAMNRRITVLLDREHQIGHTCFLGVDTLAALASTFRTRILPLLQEYFYDDWEKIRAVLNDNGSPRVLMAREHEPLTGLREDEQRDLERFAHAQQTDERGRRWPVLSLQNGRLHAQNYVGIIETRRETVIEILPKVDLSNDEEGTTTISGHAGEPAEGRSGSMTDRHEDTRKVFLTMLRDWRGLGQAQLDGASIRAIRRFDMFEAFVHLFLVSVVLLTRRGLARTYRTQEANLPYLRGRILFPLHVRENLVDRSRFYVGYDEFTADRPANRLIHRALRRLAGVGRHPANRQRVHQLGMRPHIHTPPRSRRVAETDRCRDG